MRMVKINYTMVWTAVWGDKPRANALGLSPHTAVYGKLVDYLFIQRDNRGITIT